MQNPETAEAAAGELWQRAVGDPHRVDVRALRSALEAFAHHLPADLSGLPTELREAVAGSIDGPDPQRLLVAALQLYRDDASPTLHHPGLSLALLRVAASFAPPGEARAPFLTWLSKALFSGFLRTREPAVLDESISAAREALALSRAGDVEIGARLTALTMGLTALLLTRPPSGEALDELLYEAADAAQRAVELTPHDPRLRILRLCGWADIWLLSYKLRGDDHGLRFAHGLIRQALLQPTADTEALQFRATMARNVDRHSERLTALGLTPLSAITPATPAGEDVPMLDDPAKLARYLRAKNLVHRARNGKPELLQEAAELVRALIAEQLPGHRYRPRSLLLLSAVARTRFDHTHDIDELNRAVDAAEEAVKLAAWTSVDHGQALQEAGAHLIVRYECAHDATDLERGVQRLEQAVEASTADDPPLDRAHRIRLFAIALDLRYRHHNRLDDLQAAIASSRQVLALFANHAPNAASASQVSAELSRYLISRYLILLDPADLDEAVRVAAGDPWALADALSIRYHRAGKRPEDLDEAISAARRALDGRDADSGVDACAVRRSLSALLETRFFAVLRPRSQALPHVPTRHKTPWTGLVDIVEAADLAKRAARECPEDSPHYVPLLFRLASVQLIRYELMRLSPFRFRYLKRARALLVCIAQGPTTTASQQWKALVMLGRSCALRADWTGATDHFAKALALLQVISPREASRVEREHGLRQAEGLAAMAAECALRAGRPRLAAELAESGRAFLWSQELDEPAAVERLRAQAPELADSYELLRNTMDFDGNPDSPGSDRRGPLGWLSVSGPVQPRETASRLSEVLNRIRTLDGFADFALPPAGRHPLHPGVAGPVVLLNISEYGSHALILMPDGTIPAVEFPHVSPQMVNEQSRKYHTALAVVQSPTATMSDQQHAETEISAVFAWLWRAVVGPVLDRVCTTRSASGAAYPRVWWAPGGALSRLPLHAAGDGQQRALDRVCSSYVPSLSALRRAAASPGGPLPDPRVLVVAMEQTPGEAPLPAAGREGETLKARFGSSPLSGPDATRDEVRAQLQRCEVAHLACHGSYDSRRPAMSGLLLHDHQDGPLTVLDVARLHAPAGRLAYLSACTTSAPGEVMAEEAVHLAAAFQMAGFVHVISTFQPVADDISGQVCTGVYDALSGRPGGFDPSYAAQALHLKVRQLAAEYPRTPSLWSAYLHTGP